MEVIVYFMIILIIFSTLTSLAVNEFNIVKQTENRKEARIVTMEISHLINNVYLQGEGFKQSYRLPEKINEETYIVEVNDSGVYVNSHYQLCVDETIVYNITFCGKNRKNIILTPGDTYYFERKNNSIDIYQ